MDAFELMRNSANYVFANKDSIVNNGFGFMVRQDAVSSLKFGLSVAKLHCILDQSAFQAITLVEENMTVVNNAGVNNRGVTMALLSFPKGMQLENVFTVYSFMFAMKESAHFEDEQDFYCVLIQ